jgi:hypothetical protein
LDTEFYASDPISTNPSQRSIQAKWFKEEGFRDVVKDQWDAAGSGMINVHAHLIAMHVGLHEWDRRVLKRPKRSLRKAQRELDELMRGPLNMENDQKKHELAKLIEKLLEEEEIEWQQRSRANWLQNGDKILLSSIALLLRGRKESILNN